VDLTLVAGRVLAQTIKADAPHPRFDYSAMDGYAVDTSTLPSSLPIRLKVSGSATANRIVKTKALQMDCAVRILTGACIPVGANAVVAQEEISHDGDGIILRRTPVPGENIRKRGEDVTAGDVLIEAGTCMGPLEAGVAASAGYPAVRVFRRIRVAIFTTGSELRQPGENILPGEIYDSNRFILRGLLAKPWVDVIDLRSCADKPSRLRAMLQEAAGYADVIMSAGGVSVGDEDHMVDAFRRCGGKLHVHKVAIKPGKPLVVGQIAGATYVGLPGNPGALFTSFKVIVERILRRRAGLKPVEYPECSAIANFDCKDRRGRTTYLPAILTGLADGVPSIDLLPGANSGRLHLLSQAQGFAIIEPEIQAVTRGDRVRWMRFWDAYA
jgi:molybdopterin molybdotransferase